jgi:hypothetical protein
MVYTIVLSLHNITRWLVIVFAGIALVRAYSGWFTKLEWSKKDDQAGILFTSVLDLQLLLGLLLYFIFSPLTTDALRNFSAAMGSEGTRFFSLEHELIMIAAIVVAHAGRSMSKIAIKPVHKHRHAAVWYTISILLVLSAIPWPYLDHGRPLLRLFNFTF